MASAGRSRWFRTGAEYDSEDEESEEEEEAEDEEEAAKEKEAEKKRSVWMAVSEKDGADEDQKSSKVSGVLSTKTRRLNELNDTLVKASTALKNYNFPEMLEIWEKLLKLVQKYWSLDHHAPKGFLRAVLAFDKAVKDKDDKQARKAFNKQTSQAWLALKQRTKKLMDQEIGTVLTKFRGEWNENDVELVDSEPEDDSEEEMPEDPDALGVRKSEGDEKPKEWTPEQVAKKLQEVISQRGKKATHGTDQIKNLFEVYHYAQRVDQRVEVLGQLLTAYFDLTPSMATHMPIAAWRAAYDTLVRIMMVQEDASNLYIIEAENLVDEPSPKPPQNSEEEILFARIPGNLLSFVERLQDEYTRALQFTDPHSQHYVGRLDDDGLVADALERVSAYYQRRSMKKHFARLSLRLLEHIHYRRQEEHRGMLKRQRKAALERAVKRADYWTKKAMAKQKEEPAEEVATTVKKIIGENIKDTMEFLLGRVLKYGEERNKVQALLYMIYQLALSGEFCQARDMLLMAHINDLVNQSTNTTFMILYNRVLAQLGLSAFRKGLYRDVHTCLNDLCGSNRTRELLAQALPQRPQHERKPEQETQDRMRLVPFHRHINADCLEAIHLLAAMFLEVPGLASAPWDPKRRLQSKAYNRVFFHYHSQVFVGPPENTRDHIFAASMALVEGNWQRTSELVTALSCWALVPERARVEADTLNTIKETALRCYLIKNAKYFDTLSAERLSNQFALPSNKIHSIASKMILNRELSGSWDQSTDCLRVHSNHPTRLQALANKAADRAQSLVEANERSMDTRGGGFVGRTNVQWGGRPGGKGPGR